MFRPPFEKRPLVTRRHLKAVDDDVDLFAMGILAFELKGVVTRQPADIPYDRIHYRDS